MKALFITSGPIQWASARIRAYWPAVHMGADVITGNETANAGDYDAIIYQKIFDHDNAAMMRAAGKKVYWDACDPLWWFAPDEARRVLTNVDGVVCSNEPLRKALAHWCGDSVKTYTIPDRLELLHYPLQRQHKPAEPVRFIWFGLAANRAGLFGGLTFLSRLASNGHKIELTIFDEQPDQPWHDDRFPIYHTRWTLDHENEVIAAHDIAILPAYPGPWGRVKSNNRSITAWACGLPVVDGMNYQDMEALVTNWEHRRAAGTAGYGTLALEYTSDKSAREWEAILV